MIETIVLNLPHRMVIYTHGGTNDRPLTEQKKMTNEINQLAKACGVSPKAVEYMAQKVARMMIADDAAQYMQESDDTAMALSEAYLAKALKEERYMAERAVSRPTQMAEMVYNILRA
jgi:hypothetical protein